MSWTVGRGNDILAGGPGADDLIGGDNSPTVGDTASYAGSMAGVTVRLHSFQAMGGDAEGDTFDETVVYPWTDMDEDDNPIEREATLPDIENLGFQPCRYTGRRPQGQHHQWRQGR